MPGQQGIHHNYDGTWTAVCRDCGWTEEHGWEVHTAEHAIREHMTYVRRLWNAPQHGAHDYLVPPLRTQEHAETLAIYRDGKHLILAACDYPGCGWKGPHRPRADVARADFAMHRTDLRVVLTDVDVLNDSVVALPLVWAAARLRAYNTLLTARTFGEARTDPYAAWLVDESVPVWEDQREVGGRQVRGRDRDPFDAETLWGIDGWHIWRPDPLEMQVEFLDNDAPVAAGFLEAGEERLLVEEATPVVPIAVRHAFENAIIADGRWVVRRWPGLVALFDSPPDDPWQALPTAPEPWVII